MTNCEESVDLYIGLMSGTSMDGIDAALVEMSSSKLIHGITKKYSDEVKTRLSHLMKELHTNLPEFCQLNTLIGREFAQAVHQLLEESGYSPFQIKAIGSHGQTICHDTIAPIPYTLQLGCAHTISSLTGIDVVADFRTRDVVNGGQGAPFAPLYHQELFSNSNEPVAVVNIGGISNVTFLTPGQKTRGWDVGPGNCLLDAWIQLHQGKSYDENGAWASKGQVIEPLLKQLLNDNFFKQPPPKSIGKEYFSLSWLEQQSNTEYQPVDVQATLVDLTAHCIAEGVINANRNTKNLYLCGGGTHNKHLQNKLKQRLPHIGIKSVKELGSDPDYLEAMMMAWLACQTINLTPVDLSFITGSKKKEILGAIYPIGRAPM